MSKSIKKSDHKHDYELVEMKEKCWFTHEKKCKICGHINNRIRVMDIEKAKNDIVYFAEKVLDVNLLEWQKDLLLKYQQHRKL